jgi:hypothetical protein
MCKKPNSSELITTAATNPVHVLIHHITNPRKTISSQMPAVIDTNQKARRSLVVLGSRNEPFGDHETPVHSSTCARYAVANGLDVSRPIPAQFGVQFFSPYGWEPDQVRGVMTAAAELHRLPDQLQAFLPEPQGNPGNFPWMGVCVLKKNSGAEDDRA